MIVLNKEPVRPCLEESQNMILMFRDLKMTYLALFRNPLERPIWPWGWIF